MLIVIRDSEAHLAGESCEQFPDSGKIALERREPDELSKLSVELCPECFPELSE